MDKRTLAERNAWRTGDSDGPLSSCKAHESAGSSGASDPLDVHLDAILKAAGSALKHYTMQKSLDDMRSALRAALPSTPQPGMVTVPREPTREMLIDGAKAVRDFHSEKSEYPRTRAMYRAMLDAALRSGGRETSGE